MKKDEVDEYFVGREFISGCLFSEKVEAIESEGSSDIEIVLEEALEYHKDSSSRILSSQK